MKTLLLCFILLFVATGCQSFNEVMKDYDPFLYGNPWSK